ncbi:site-specific DNA-methyltransferase [Asticcacaulis tiandongensis]|uniref:site-specific DNA-methyltransferase n=1 Tax=Asticcacaulis tiandongensis TaxID=2565365 RepID=UPI0011299DD9|nr:DNA methyltransferase [Asticcacaulis tiandongensis]
MNTNAKLKSDQSFRELKLSKTRARRQAVEAANNSADLAAAPRRNDILPELIIQNVDLSALRSAGRQTRKVTDAHVVRLMASIADLGFTVPILIRSGEIVDGHTRVEAARRLQLTQVPAIEVSHLSSAETRKLRLALNRTAELGVWDIDQLKVEMTDLLDLEIDLGSTGFTAPELDIILLDDLSDNAAVARDECVPEALENEITRLGDIWQCGDHRILCGNALEAFAYDQLLGDVQVQAVLSDPPYNVRIKGNVSGLGKTTHKEFAMASGEMDSDQWQAFLDAVVGHWAQRVGEGAVIYAFMDWRSIDRLYQAGFRSGLKLINLAVWDKEAGAMGTLYRSAYELVAVFCKGETPRTNNVGLGRHGRNRTNVWKAPGANRRGSSANAMLHLHATPKPVELCVDAILDVTQKDDIVLDSFLGSGTTLIAAEKSKRRCYGIELEPRFVDVCIRRWQDYTGQQAILEETGETFETVCARREAAQASADGEGSA